MSGLTRVSFARPITPDVSGAPRLPGAGQSARFWTPAESQVIRDHYESKGAAYCKTLLPGRPLSSIYRKANDLGVKDKNYRGRPTGRRVLPPDLDELIREAWPSLAGRGAVKALADSLGLPRHVVSVRALKLGLTLPHRKEPDWSEAELRLLAKVPLHDPKRASRIFAEQGFRRTPGSIVNKAKRVGLSLRYSETLSANAAGRILGVDSKTIIAAIIAGQIRAEKRPTERLAQQGGNPWSITRRELRRYVIADLARIDLRKVEKFEFVALLTEERDAVARGRCYCAVVDDDPDTGVRLFGVFTEAGELAFCVPLAKLQRFVRRETGEEFLEEVPT